MSAINIDQCYFHTSPKCAGPLRGPRGVISVMIVPFAECGFFTFGVVGGEDTRERIPAILADG